MMAKPSFDLWAWFQHRNWLSPDERGATATEYGLLTGFIAIVIVGGVGAFGVALNLYFGELSTGIRNALGVP
jgi:pilus assembly protein Flp/PilA